jgi:hypothetical protein
MTLLDPVSAYRPSSSRIPVIPVDFANLVHGQREPDAAFLFRSTSREVQGSREIRENGDQAIFSGFDRFDENL